MFRKKKPERYIVCPNCGAVIKEKSRACPECGADEETGWADILYPDDLLTPSEEEKPSAGSGIWKKIAQYGSMVIVLLIVYGLIAYFIPFGQFIGIFVSAGLLTAFLSVRFLRPRENEEGRDPEKELLAMCGYDPDRVERLVMYEWQRNPAATREEMVRTAIGRLKRDRQ